MQHIEKTMCWKTWNDLTISLPNRNVKWCCKTSYTKEQLDLITFDADTLNLDFLINNPVLKKRKSDLSSGVKTKDCAGCWKNEDVSGTSARTLYEQDISTVLLNQKYKSKYTNGIEFNNAVKDTDTTSFIELELTNKCNMACVYCWEGLSSRWQKETGNRMPDTDNAIFEKVLEVLDEYWDKKLKDNQVIDISLLGGEPFFTEHMFTFIEEFIMKVDRYTGNPKQQVYLTITTNLNFPQHKLDKFMDLVRKTPRITYLMQLSGEAVGERSEFIRWGLDWKKWDANLTLFIEESKTLNNLKIGFGCAHNNLSLPYFKEFLEYLDEKITSLNYEKPIIFHNNWIDSPSHLSPANLDSKFKDTLQESIDYLLNDFRPKVFQKSRYTNCLNSIKSLIGTDFNDASRENAFKQFKILEDRRKISFTEQFPHYNSIVKNPHK